jgi:hypothetical protein
MCAVSLRLCLGVYHTRDIRMSDYQSLDKDIIGLRATSQSWDTVQHGARDMAGIADDYTSSLLDFNNLTGRQAPRRTMLLLA